MKTTYADGHYSITLTTEEGEFVEEYTKAGKLIEKYKVVYPSVGRI